MSKMTLSRICAPAKPRVFLKHSETHSRVLLKGDDYSEPVRNADLYQWLDAHIGTISPAGRALNLFQNRGTAK